MKEQSLRGNCFKIKQRNKRVVFWKSKTSNFPQLPLFALVYANPDLQSTRSTQYLGCPCFLLPHFLLVQFISSYGFQAPCFFFMQLALWTWFLPERRWSQGGGQPLLPANSSRKRCNGLKLCQRSFRLDNRKDLLLKSGEVLEQVFQRSDGITVSRSVRETCGCGTDVYGGGWWLDRLILEVFPT